MKSKIILMSFLMLLVVLFNGGVFAYGDHVTCKNVDGFCKYQGMYNNLEGIDEEFQMLLEPTMHPNFHWMYQCVISIIAMAGDPSNAKCLAAVRNPNCNISKYTKKLFQFYEDNKAKFTENITGDGYENDDPEFEHIFAVFKSLRS